MEKHIKTLTPNTLNQKKMADAVNAKHLANQLAKLLAQLLTKNVKTKIDNLVYIMIEDF